MRPGALRKTTTTPCVGAELQTGVALAGARFATAFQKQPVVHRTQIPAVIFARAPLGRSSTCARSRMNVRAVQLRSGRNESDARPPHSESAMLCTGRKCLQSYRPALFLGAVSAVCSKVRLCPNRLLCAVGLYQTLDDAEVVSSPEPKAVLEHRAPKTSPPILHSRNAESR